MKIPDRSREISDLASRWQLVRKGTLIYGAGTPEQQAAEFHFKEVLPVIVANTRAHWDSRCNNPRRPDILITMAGFSPETTMIAFAVLRPKYLFVVTSRKAVDGFDKIYDFVTASHDNIRHSRIHHLRCNPIDPHDIYDKVKNILKDCKLLEEKELVSVSGEPINAIVDITGGKKVMSAAAALLAWRLSVPLCYIDSEFDETTRRPKPGSERLIYLENPVAIYAEEEINIATEVFNGGHYAQARTQFAALSERVQDSIFACFMRDLSALYCAWCDLEISALEKAAEQLKQRLVDSRVRRQLQASAPEVEGHLHDQLKFIHRIVDEERPALLLCFYLLGRYYADQMNRHDFAALLFYRTMEGTLRQRLEDLFPGMTAGREADYSKVDRDLPEWLAQYNSLIPESPDAPPATHLPGRLMLMPMAKLLLAAGDSALIHDKRHLGHLQGLSELRNQSILAHGFTSVPKGANKTLEVAAQQMLDGLFKARGHSTPSGKKLVAHCETLRFVQLPAGWSRAVH